MTILLIRFAAIAWCVLVWYLVVKIIILLVHV